MGKHVGRLIEVSYIESGTSKVEKSVLKFLPNNEFFYLAQNNGRGYHICYWDRTSFGLKGGLDREAVRLIRDEYGNEIYRAEFAA